MAPNNYLTQLSRADGIISNSIRDILIKNIFWLFFENMPSKNVPGLHVLVHLQFATIHADNIAMTVYSALCIWWHVERLLLVNYLWWYRISLHEHGYIYCKKYIGGYRYFVLAYKRLFCSHDRHFKPPDIYMKMIWNEKSIARGNFFKDR